MPHFVNHLEQDLNRQQRHADPDPLEDPAHEVSHAPHDERPEPGRHREAGAGHRSSPSPRSRSSVSRPSGVSAAGCAEASRLERLASRSSSPGPPPATSREISVEMRSRFERGVDWSELDDVILGCANQAGEDNRNLARMAGLLAGLPDSSGGVTLNRLCGSGLDAVAMAARSIHSGDAPVAKCIAACQ